MLALDDKPSFTVYRMRFTDAAGAARDIAGVVGGLEVVDEGAGGVLPHERTTPKASTDRLDLTRATAANLSPVWGSQSGRGPHRGARPSRATWWAGWSRTVWSMSSNASSIRAASRRSRHCSGADDVLIADGHHRYAISRTYRDEIRAATGSSDTPAEQTLAFVSELVADQLSVEAIHRLYPKLHPEFAKSFVVAEISTPDGRNPGGHAARRLPGAVHARSDVAADARNQVPSPACGSSTVPGWSHALGDVEVTYQHGLAETLAAVDDGRAEAAVLIRPVSVAEIERTAREGAADAAEVDLLHPEAEDRLRAPAARAPELTP